MGMFNPIRLCGGMAMVGWVVLRPFFYFWFVWLVCGGVGMAGALVQCNKWPICMMWRWWPANIVLCLMGE